MTNGTTNNSTVSRFTTRDLLDSWAALSAKLAALKEADDRKIFVFDGTLGDLRAKLAEQHVTIQPTGDRGPIPGELFQGYEFAPRAIPWSLGLHVWHSFGRFYIGTPTALRRMAGLEPMPEPRMRPKSALPFGSISVSDMT